MKDKIIELVLRITGMLIMAFLFIMWTIFELKFTKNNHGTWIIINAVAGSIVGSVVFDLVKNSSIK